METKKERLPGPPGPGGSKTWSGEILGRNVFWQAETPEEADRREQCSELAKLLFFAWFMPNELSSDDISRAQRLIKDARFTGKSCRFARCTGAAIEDVGMCSGCANRQFDAALK